MKKLLTLVCLFALVCPIVQAQEDTVPPLEQASKEQQKSISKLVYALKEVRKAIPPPGEPTSPDEKNPFKDNQEYKHESPEKQLQQLAQQQKDIIEQLKEQAQQTGEGGTLKELAEEQQKISDELEKIAENPSLGADLRQAVKDAKTSSGQATEAMKAEAEAESQVGAQKTLAKINDALKQLKQNAQKSAEEALDKAEEKLADAKQEMQGNNGDQAAQKAEEAQQILKDAAEEQRLSGSEAKRKMLDELAKQIEESELVKALSEKPNDPETVEKLEEIREAIAKARQGNRTARDELEQTVQAMKNLQQEMKYRAKHAQETTDEQMDTILKEDGQLARRIERAQKQMEDQKQGSNPGTCECENPAECQCENPGPGEKDGQGKGQGDSPNPSDNQSPDGQGGPGSGSNMQNDVQKIAALQRRWIEKDSDAPPHEVVLKELIETTDRILIKAQQTLDALDKEIVVRNIGKEKVPEKYKDDVATYFEQLSNPEDKQSSNPE